jgi:hypothetical protein
MNNFLRRLFKRKKRHLHINTPCSQCRNLVGAGNLCGRVLRCSACRNGYGSRLRITEAREPDEECTLFLPTQELAKEVIDEPA